MYDTVGIDERDDEPHFHKHLRNIAINWACRAHLEQCLNDTKAKLESFFDGETLSRNHEPAILCNGLRKVSDGDYESMMDVFRSTTDRRLRELYIRSMSCMENEAILMGFIKAVIESGNNVLDDEWKIALESMCANSPIGVRVALRVLRIHHERIMDM